MNRYTIYCTEEQTRKALKLGAPINIYSEEYTNRGKLDNDIYIINDIVFSNNEAICRNEDGYLVCIVGEEPNRTAYYVPTAEEMIGWLRSKGIQFHFDDETGYYHIGHANDDLTSLRMYGYSNKKELDAIDAALEYLTYNNLVK